MTTPSSIPPSAANASRMRRSGLWIALGAAVLALGGTGVAVAVDAQRQDQTAPASTAAAPAATTPAAASPTPSVDRGFACRTAIKLTGTAAELITEFATTSDPARFDLKPLAAAIDDMRAARNMLPPALAAAYDAFLDPMYEIYQAVSNGGEVSIDGDLFRTDSLQFMRDCTEWMNQG